MGVMDFFRTTSDGAPASTTQQPAAVQQPAAATTPDGKMPGTNQEPVNPLDAYNKLWENANKDADTPPVFDLDPKILNEVSSSLDFTQGINPELMQKATNGDVNALIQLMNQVAQRSYQTSLQHGSKLTDKFIGARSAFDLKGIDGKVKSELTNSALAATPNYSHPVVKRQLNLIANQLQSVNPEASPQEIAQAAQDYLKELASAINPETGKPKEDSAADGEVDWSKYLA
jgi:hypothetical protein